MSGGPDEPDRAAYHGPASPWAAAVGLLVTGTPYLLGVQGTAWLMLALAPPAVGLVLLAAGDRVRHVATGLLASGLVVPLLLMGPCSRPPSAASCSGERRTPGSFALARVEC